MAKIVFALNQSLDGYVDHTAFQPDSVVFRHFINDIRGLTGSIYGRRMYETMRYWDKDDIEWDESEREYAVAWRSKPKWVVSRTLESVGPNSILAEKVGRSMVPQGRKRISIISSYSGGGMIKWKKEMGKGEKSICRLLFKSGEIV